MFEKLKAYADKLTENLNERGLYYEVKVVGENDETIRPENGVYIVYGSNETDVQNTSFDPHYMVQEYEKQYIENYMYFPECTIYKLNDTRLSTASEFCNQRDAIHLINELFPRYGLKVPQQITQNDFLAISRAYFGSIADEFITSDQDSYKKELEYLLKVVDSGLTQDEYDKKNGEFSLLENSKLAKAISKKAKEVSQRTVTYIPKAKNCVPDSGLKRSGNLYKSVNIDHDILPYFEKEMEQYPNIKYSLEKTGIPYLYGDYGYKYWHMLTFPVQSEKIVAGIMHKYERDLQGIAKKYTPGRTNIFGTEVLALDFDQIYEFALKNNIDFYFDEKSVYTRTTTDRIGIVTENPKDRDALVNTLTGFIASKLEGSYLDKDPEYIEKQEIEANRKAVKARFDREDDER